MGFEIFLQTVQVVGETHLNFDPAVASARLDEIKVTQENDSDSWLFDLGIDFALLLKTILGLRNAANDETNPLSMALVLSSANTIAASALMTLVGAFVAFGFTDERIISCIDGIYILEGEEERERVLRGLPEMIAGIREYNE